MVLGMKLRISDNLSENGKFDAAPYVLQTAVSIGLFVQDDPQVLCVCAFVSHHLVGLVDLANF